ncbi:hypothetical protein GCM10014715_78120 [Streptomyces spiralis]|uniref:Uncharacterized protein n=1 Tax=Streptomyces spiralis TaxID=66376 RepID=A0A919AJN7_9ACTN|nr:hypothetical protein GCM10014715_78120 [Streptomyces spiralis]
MHGADSGGRACLVHGAAAHGAALYVTDAGVQEPHRPQPQSAKIKVARPAPRHPLLTPTDVCATVLTRARQRIPIHALSSPHTLDRWLNAPPYNHRPWSMV